MQEFETRYKELNAEQKKAVDTIEGPVMVIAGPGTGKTTILTLRIANILQETDTQPENILALTFTESGAFAMRKKLFDIIGAAAYKVNIHTFHGFSSHTIEKHPDYFPRIIGSSVITQPEQIKIIEKALEQPGMTLLRPYGDKSYYVGPILREISVLKRENVKPEDFRSSLKAPAIRDKSEKKGATSKTTKRNGDEPSAADLEKLEKQYAKNVELAQVYEFYESELMRQKYFDFEDMLLELIRAMEANVDFKLMLQEEYQYILADEHQDANQSQNRILELLADFHDNPNLFIVGDDKQAIYRFQGASLENFLYFTKKYNEATIVDLEHNYRSHQGILDASHSIIENNPTIPGRKHKKLLALQMGRAPIMVTECKTIKSELEYVCQFIKRIVDNKGSQAANEVAILYRDNKHAAPISAMLTAHGIMHRIESDNDLLKEPEVVKIIIICRAIHDLANSEYLAGALLLAELKADTAQVAELCSLANRERKPLYRVIEEVSSGQSFGSSYVSVTEAYKQVQKWAHISQSLPFTDFLQKIIQETNMMASIVSDPNSLERLSVLQAFYDHVAHAAQSKKTFYLKEFIEYISISHDHGISARRGYSEHIGGVRLMTAHRAKGLEFNHVFIVHAVNGVWGNRTSRNLFNIPIVEHARNVGRIEDERRLFYVALTRARETVNISYARSDDEKELLPAQFISEIEPDLIEFDELDIDAETVYSHHFFKPPKIEDTKRTQNSILEKSFVSSKFLGQPLSVTHLNNYLACAWQYFFVNLIRVPQAPTKHQMYGTAIHAVLRVYFNALKNGETLPLQQILALLKHEIDMQPMSVTDRNESLEKGTEALTGYFETYGGTFNPNLIMEYGLKAALSVEKGSLEITGKLDKVEFIDDYNVTVVDFKTSKPKSKNEIEGKTRGSDGNYKRQLVFYKMLIQAQHEMKAAGCPAKNLWNMQSGEIDFIEPNDRGVYKKESFQIADEEVETLKKVIQDMATDIVSLGFIDKKCATKNCQFCALGHILSHNSADPFTTKNDRDIILDGNKGKPQTKKQK